MTKKTIAGFGEAAKRLLPPPSAFESTVGGKPTALYLISNTDGMTAAITNYGARVVGLVVPDPQGNPVDVVTGPGSIIGYTEGPEYYLGATIGRVGNRIAGASFQLDGKTYPLYANNGPNSLHGGKKGFESAVWDAKQPDASTLVLTRRSPDGDEGFPGNLDVKVTYRITEAGGLQIAYEAQTDQRTPVNLTNHAYFNLNGEGAGLVNAHQLQIEASRFTPVDADLIPTGELRPVGETPFDFRELSVVGSRLHDADEQLEYGGGYDHNFALDSGREYALAAVAIGDQTGIRMEVHTDMPGIQFYGGNAIPSGLRLKHGSQSDYRTAFCLETQFFPDAVNQPDFDSVILDPGKVFTSVTLYQF